MAKVTRPKKEIILIGGVAFEVRVVRDLRDDQNNALQGDTDLNTRTIRLDSSYSADRQAQTLFHEVIHAALYVSGQHEYLTEQQEEAVILALEHTLWPVLPQILARSSTT